MAKNPYKRILTPSEAVRAIYIDFEGRKDEPPALLGSLYFEGRKTSDVDRLVLRHDILDPALQCLAGAVDLDGLHRYDCYARSLPQAIQDLVRRAENQDRSIVAWSHHEIRKIDEAELSAYLDQRIERRYRDGKATARSWRLTLFPEWQLVRDDSGRADRLPLYFERIGFDVPSAYQGGNVGETIKRLRRSLVGGGGWVDLTDNQQRRWTELLLHNFYDCDGLREIVQLSARELEAAKRS